MRLAIQQEEANLQVLKTKKIGRLRSLPRDTLLIILQPELEAVALIVPLASLSPRKSGEEAREKVEIAGMEYVMRYELE